MSTISSATTNPYTIGFSTSDLSVTYPATTSASASSTTTTNSGTSTSASTTGSVASVLTAATGLDVNNLVNGSMASDQSKLASLVSTAQITTWEQDRYRSVMSSLDTFNSTYFDVLNQSTYALSPSSFSTSSATSSDSTTASASVGTTAATGNYTISSATLATAAKVTSATNASLSSLKSSDSVSTLLTDIVGSSGTSPASTTFSIGGTSYTYNFTGTDTVSKLMSDLSTKTGYTFNYSELSGKVSIANSSTGSANNLAFSFDSSDTFMNGIFGTTGTSGNSTTANGSTTYAATGTDGKFTITEPSGDSNTVTESSNKFTLDGVAYNIANAIATTDKPVTINVALDVSSAMSKIQDFVTNYNNLISSISSVTTEKRDYSYKPLSSTQEASMTASAITAWNQKAQTGLLNGDSTLNSMLNDMRTAFYTPVTGSGVSYSSVGLSTSDDYTNGGKITIDTAKLKAALISDPQKVINLFSQVSTTTYDQSVTSSADKTTRTNGEGIFQRISDIYQRYAGSGIDANGSRSILSAKAGKVGTATETSNTETTEITTETKSITDFQAKMALDKTRYTNMYTALQTALSSLNSQTNAISSLLSSGSSSG